MPERAGQEACDRQPDAQGPVRLPGMCRAGPDLLPDPLKPVRARFDLVGGGVQFPAQEIGEVLPAVGAVAGPHSASCSSSARSAAMPRAVWLLTAPRLICIVAAISASERSA
jgi:hypothetical protein